MNFDDGMDGEENDSAIGVACNETVESSVLVRSLAVRTSRETREHLEQLGESDWDELVSQARAQSVDGILFAKLSREYPEVVLPTATMSTLQQAYGAAKTRNLRRWHRAATIAQAFNSARVPVIFLKGVHLACAIYRDLGVRTMNDTDLLTRTQDLMTAQELMLELGYGPRERSSIADDMTWNVHIYPFYLDEGDGARDVVDVHWTIERETSPFSIDMDAMWRSADTTLLLGEQISVLGNADLILHLCLHAGYQHGFAIKLRALYDIALLLSQRADAIDWREIANHARKARATKFVYACVAAASRTFQVPLHPHVLDSFAPNLFDQHVVSLIGDSVIRSGDSMSPEWIQSRRTIAEWIRQAVAPE